MAGRTLAGPRTSQERAQLFTSLSRCADAGLPIADCLKKLAAQQNVHTDAITSAQRLVAAGQTLTTAGRACGLFLAWEAPLLQAAEHSGRLPRIMSSLAARHEQRAADTRSLKARLAYPLMLLALALFIVPLPALIQGTLSAGGYLMQSAGVLMLIFLAFRLAKHVWDRAQNQQIPRLPAAAEVRLPLVSRYAQLRTQYDYLAMLQLGIAAGLPIAEAAANAAHSLRNPILASAYGALAACLEKGEALGEALMSAKVLPDSELSGLIATAEAAGRLEDGLAGIVAQLRERLRSWQKNLTDWLPRMVYFLLLVAIAVSML